MAVLNGEYLKETNAHTLHLLSILGSGVFIHFFCFLSCLSPVVFGLNCGWVFDAAAVLRERVWEGIFSQMKCANLLSFFMVYSGNS